MNNYVINSTKSFHFFLSFLNSKLEKELKNSVIKKKHLKKVLELYYEIENSNASINIISIEEQFVGLSQLLNIIISYKLFFHQKEIYMITDNSGKTLFDHYIMYLSLINIAYGIIPNLNLDDNKKTLTIKNICDNTSILHKENSFISYPIIRDKKIDYIFFDNWELLNESKITAILTEINAREEGNKIKTFLTLDKTKVSNLTNLLDSSIIVNEIKFKK